MRRGIGFWQVERATFSRWLVVAAVLLFFYLALSSLVDDSPTMDEQNHLARGLAFLRTGDPRLSLEHPPLVNGLSALPVLMLPGVRLPTDHPSWNAPQGWYAFAEQLLWVYNADVERMIFLARLPVVLMTLALGLVGFHFGRRLWGPEAGLTALGLLLFDPNVMAHGRYSTTDVGGTLFLFLAAFLLWRCWRDDGRHWGRVLAAGLGLGLAFGSKLSTLGFVPIFGMMAVLPLFEERWTIRRAGQRLLKLLAAGLASVVVVWAVFGFQWGPFGFQSEPFEALNGRSGPMPTFWAGIEQIVSLSGGGRPTFLLGEFSADGFPAYFPIAFLVKTPLPVLALLVLAPALVVRPGTRKRALFLFVPALFYFGLSMLSALNIGYRHLLPMLPFLYVLIGGLATVRLRAANYKLHPRLIVGILVGSLVLVNLWIYPHYLSYFNLAAGGPSNGGNILVDSNIDWGQDLLRLRDWMAANEVGEVKLAWFGSADPAYYGIDYEPLPGLPRHFNLWWDVPFNSENPEPGIYAVSISNLWEIPLEEKVVFPWFRAREPDDRIGYSILIYRVGSDELAP